MIEFSETQGNVLYAYGDRFPCARYILLRVEHVSGARERLRGWFEHITFGRRPWETSDAGATNGGVLPSTSQQAFERPHVNVAFTYAGLSTLGVPDEFLYAYPHEFQQGARARAADNGDIAASAPENWVDGVGTGHVLVVIHATNETDRDRLAEQLLRGSATSLTVLHDLPAALLTSDRRTQDNGSDATAPSCGSRSDREHFGFADGCSQPAIEGVHDDPVGSGVYARCEPRWWRPLQTLELLLEDLGLKQVRKQWRAIRAGEFMLGYENEDGILPSGPPAPLGPNGTFMVYRPISQDVVGFNAHIDSEAARLKMPAAQLRAKLVGRWSDGTPLTLSPERPDGLIANDRRRANDFLYQERGNGYPGDTEGYGCPLGAHVRRSNPRDALPGGGERTMRHRIIRRGMPYGERGGDGDRGLAFVCFGASIRDGFEFIQRTWCNAGTQFGLGSDRDPILQQGNPDQLSSMVIQAPGVRSVVLQAPPQPYVTVRGCEYLFVPARSAYTWLTNLS